MGLVYVQMELPLWILLCAVLNSIPPSYEQSTVSRGVTMVKRLDPVGEKTVSNRLKLVLLED